jgi:hypothetical protein
MALNALRLTHAALATCAILAGSACSSHYLEVPPRVDLAPYGKLALVAFRNEQGDSGLSAVATQRFSEALLQSQSGIELLEISASDSLVKHLGKNVDGVTLAQALGKARNVPAVFLGEINLSHVKPSGRISASGYANVKATVSAEMSVRLIATSTGGTVWRSSATSSEQVGKVSVSDGLPTVSVRNPDDAYGEMLGALATQVTRDFRSTWVKQ